MTAAKNKMYSIEFLFQECNLKKKVLHLELSRPVQLEDVMTNDIILLNVKTDKDKDIVSQNAIKAGINTNDGTYHVIVSDKNGNPLNPQIINLNLQDIVNVWKK